MKIKKFKAILFFWIFLLLFGFCKISYAFENEFALYSNPVLSPNEDLVAFECGTTLRGYSPWYDPETESDIFLVNIDGSDLRQLTLEVESFSLSPDKSKILIETLYGIYLVDLKSYSMPEKICDRFPTYLFGEQISPIKQFTWSPDSKKFFLSRAPGFNGDRIYSVIDAETLQEQVIEVPKNERLFEPVRWSPDSKSIIYVIGASKSWEHYGIRSFSLKEKVEEEFVFGLWGQYSNPLISPDGRKLLYGLNNIYKLRFVKTPSGERIRRFITRDLCQVTDIPDWVEKELKSSVWSRKNEKVIKSIDIMFLDGRYGDVKLVWSSDGEKILLKGKDELWLYNLSDSSFVPLHNDSNFISEVIWSADQKEIFFVTFYKEDTNQDGVIDIRDEAFGDLKVFDLSGKSPKTLLEHIQDIKGIDLSSDAKFLCFEREGNIWTLEIKTNKFSQLTSEGGRKPYWLANDEKILFENNKSLYAIDKDGKNLVQLTIAKGINPGWLPDGKAIVLESQGKLWKVALNSLEISEINKPKQIVCQTKGDKFEVYIKEMNNPNAPDLNEVWITDLQTSEKWRIKGVWKNWSW